MIFVLFSTMFQKVIFSGIAEFVGWLIIWKASLLSLNSTQLNNQVTWPQDVYT